MPKFFVDKITGDSARITGPDARHIVRALRCREGEELTLCDGRGVDCRCVISGFDGDEVQLRVIESVPASGELPLEVTLYQALPKADKLEWIVQKSVELGVQAVVPVLTERCVSRPDGKSMEKKCQRLGTIAREAAQQSGRGRVPWVLPLMTFPEAVKAMSRAQAGVLFYEKGGRQFGSVLKPNLSELAIMVGPEGGFSPQEAAFAEGCGVTLCTMGPRILRCETAPLYALSAVGFWYENQ